LIAQYIYFTKVLSLLEGITLKNYKNAPNMLKIDFFINERHKRLGQINFYEIKNELF